MGKTHTSVASANEVSEATIYSRNIIYTITLNLSVKVVSKTYTLHHNYAKIVLLIHKG